MKTDMKVIFTDETRETLTGLMDGRKFGSQMAKSVIVVSGANRAGVA